MTFRKIKSGAALAAALLLFAACSGSSKNEEAKSMSRIYDEEGVPVNVREMQPEQFSVFLKYPAQFNARTESTAYASLSEVVRQVHVKVGDYVERDQSVVSFSLDNPKYQQAKLSLESAQSAFNRTKALFEQNGVSRQDYDNAKTQYDLAGEGFKSIRDLVEVEAPISGYITQLNVKETSNVSPGDALFTVSNMDGYEALFYVTPMEIDKVRTGAQTVIDSGTEVLKGHVSEVALNLDAKKKAFPARAYFDGSPRSLVSGMSVDIAVESYSNPAALVVSRKDLIQTGEGWYAFIARGEKAARTKLVIGQARGLELEVLEGINPGDLLITDGSRNLADSTPIRVVDRLAAEK